MRQYERSGVTVDQCVECRGIFLDRGELERLIDAEANWYGGQQAASAPGPQSYPPASPGYPASHGGHYGYHGHYRHKRRKSFLSELFD